MKPSFCCYLIHDYLSTISKRIVRFMSGLLMMCWMVKCKLGRNLKELVTWYNSRRIERPRTPTAGVSPFS